MCNLQSRGGAALFPPKGGFSAVLGVWEQKRQWRSSSTAELRAFTNLPAPNNPRKPDGRFRKSPSPHDTRAVSDYRNGGLIDVKYLPPPSSSTFNTCCVNEA